MTTCTKTTHVYAERDARESPCLRKDGHNGICCADRAVASYLDQPVTPKRRCAVCPRFHGGTCPLCACGLEPMPGLNDEIVYQLASFLYDGAARSMIGPETVLGAAARLVRENGRAITTGSLHDAE